MKRKFDRCGLTECWNDYRRQRNYVTKVRKKSIRKYLNSRCEHGAKDFWDTVKPFFTDKGKGGSNRIML